MTFLNASHNKLSKLLDLKYFAIFLIKKSVSSHFTFSHQGYSFDIGGCKLFKQRNICHTWPIKAPIPQKARPFEQQNKQDRGS
jgi:hypothetical protein